jgi:hypothetical protein
MTREGARWFNFFGAGSRGNCNDETLVGNGFYAISGTESESRFDVGFIIAGFKNGCLRKVVED